MIKTFKKAIAIMLTLVFVLSLVPVSGLAETSKTTVNFAFDAKNIAENAERIDFGYAYSGNKTTWKQKSEYTGSTSDDLGYGMYLSGQYPAFAQIDLSGYEEILKNEGTTIHMKLVMRGKDTAYAISDHSVYFAPDNCDFIDFSSDANMNYTIANDSGFMNTDNLFYANSDTTDVTLYSSGEISPENLINVMDSNSGNSKISLYFTGNGTNTSGKTSRINIVGSSYFAISYDASKIDNQSYVNSAAEKLTWNIISSDASNTVSQKLNLPKKFYGTDVTWTSTNNGVINPSSGEVVVGNSPVPVTLTANISYTSALGGSASLKTPLTFDVVVRKPAVLEDGYIPLSNGAVTRSEKKDTAYGLEDGTASQKDHFTYIRFGPGYYSTAQFDFSGYEEILKNSSTTANVSFETKYMGSGKHYAYDYNVYMIADSNDKYVGNELNYNDATTIYDMYNTEGRPIFYTKSPANAVYSSGERDTFSGDVSIPDIINVLSEGTDNSLITLSFKNIYSDAPASYITISGDKVATGEEIKVNTGLTITYDKNEIDNKAYLTEVKDALTWNVLSKGAQDKVSADLYLPTKFKGADIEWETDGTIIKSSGEVDFENNKSAKVTIKAKMSYTNILNETVIDEKTFEVTISDGTCDIGEPTLVKEADKFNASWAIENYSGSDITYYVYLAAYSNGELVALTPVTYVAKNGMPTSIAPSVDCKEGYTAKLIIIEDDKLTPFYKAIEK